jgi:hypothetical protein
MSLKMRVTYLRLKYRPFDYVTLLISTIRIVDIFLLYFHVPLPSYLIPESSNKFIIKYKPVENVLCKLFLQ